MDFAVIKGADVLAVITSNSRAWQLCTAALGPRQPVVTISVFELFWLVMRHHQLTAAPVMSSSYRISSWRPQITQHSGGETHCK